MRWWGWGEDGHAVPLPAAAEALLRDELGADPQRGGRRWPSSRWRCRIPPAGPGARAPGGRRGRGARERRPRGPHRARAGALAIRPGAHPLRRRLERARRRGGAGIARAGGGGARGLRRPAGGGGPVWRRHERGGRRGAGARRASPPWCHSTFAGSTRLVEVDRTSLTARLDAGLLGPEAERRLGAEGITLGPLPPVVRVLDRRRLGGHALRRPGVHGLRPDRRAGGGRCAASRPAGEIGTRLCPPSAAGPSLRELIVGSEGVLGVICEATLRVRPRRPRAATRAGHSPASPRAATRSA